MIVGHDRAVADLKKLALGRAFSHAYAFFGPEGVGKRLIALSLAAYLERGEFERPGKQPLSDMHLIEPTPEKTIGIDAVRAAGHFLRAKPNLSPYRTLIINDSEHLTPEAENALLKVTEEPPSTALLILIVRDPELLAPTLASRLQKIYFGTVNRRSLAEWLIEEKKISAKKAEALAKESFGSPGFAAAILEDKKLEKLIALAKEFLSCSGGARSMFIKTLLEPRDFDILGFIDMVVIMLAQAERKDFRLSHRLLALRRDMRFLNLNPRLQLEGLSA